MFVGTAGMAGLMIGAAGFPVATPVVLGSWAIALGLGLVVGVTACAVALGNGLGRCKAAAARRQRSGRKPSLLLISSKTVTR